MLSPHCGCGCRPSDADQPGCGCKECQPGPGIDHEGNRHRLTTVRRARMAELLERDEGTLSELEQDELDGLLGTYLYSVTH